MASSRRSALERIESLTRQPADFPFDGWVVEKFTNTVNVKPINSDKVKRNVRIPDHIPADKITKGVAVKLDNNFGQPVLIAIYPSVAELPNYAGKGSVIPHPPAISVQATREGWQVSWTAVRGADRYPVGPVPVIYTDLESKEPHLRGSFFNLGISDL